MKHIIMFLLMVIFISSCTVAKIYKLNKPRYSASADDPRIYIKNTDSMEIQVKAGNKMYGNFYVWLSITNNRSDTVFMDISDGKYWLLEGGDFPVFLDWYKGGKVISEDILVIAPDKTAFLRLFNSISEFSDGLWIDTVYAYPGVIRTSAGFEIALDTLQFILPDE